MIEIKIMVKKYVFVLTTLSGWSLKTHLTIKNKNHLDYLPLPQATCTTSENQSYRRKDKLAGVAMIA